MSEGDSMEGIFIRKFRDDILKRDAVKGREELDALIAEYQKKYPDYQKVKSFHDLIGSTPGPEQTIDDFPGIDAVRGRLISILNNKM